MVYIMMADGFEEIEALGTIDILRRCGIGVQTLSVTGRRVVEGAHGIVVKCDSLFRRNHMNDADAIIIPGGMKGALALKANQVLRQAIAQHAVRGTILAAICAGPMVLANAGVIRLRHVTCYPTLMSELGNVIFHKDALAVRHDNIITGAGPAATPAFAFAIAESLVAPTVVAQVRKDMLYPSNTEFDSKVLVFRGEKAVEPISRVSTNNGVDASAQLQRPSAAKMLGGADADELIF